MKNETSKPLLGNNQSVFKLGQIYIISIKWIRNLMNNFFNSIQK
jgi:hypothetical protein